MLKQFLFAVVVVAVAGPFDVRAAWEPPKDGRITDKQVGAYAQVMKEWVGILQASGKAVEKSSGAAALGVAAAADTRFKAALAKAGLSQEEFHWVGEKVWEARSALMVADMFAKGKADVAEQTRKNDQQQAEAKARTARYEAALKAGRRVLDQEQRKSAVEQATEDAKTYAAEVKDLEAQVKELAAQAAASDAEAKKADALAAKPPAEVPADERADYVTERREEAKAAREAAKEHRTQEAEARKAVAEAQAGAAHAAARAKDPEVVAAADAKDVREQNESHLESTKADLKRLEEAKGLLTQMAVHFEQQWTESMAKLNKQNLEVVQKRLPELDAVFGGK